MTAEMLFDGAHLRVALAGPGPDQAKGLMVTFDVRTAGKSDFGPLLRSSNFQRAGFAQLSIRTRVNDWFINPETTALEQALPAMTAPYRVVRALGYSMGGYGALRFAAAARLSSMVLVAPQWSIHPGVVPFDRRFRPESKGFDRALGDLTGRLPPGLGGIIVYDPFVRPDRRHARLIQGALPQMRAACLPFGGHPPVRVLAQSGKSGLLMQAATADQPPIAAILAAHKAGRRGNEGYWSRLARHATAGHPQLAAVAAARVAQLSGAVAQERVDGAAESP